MSNNDFNSQSPGPGPNTPQQQGGWIDIASWVVDVGLIFAFWPLGVVLTVMKTRGRDVIGDLLRGLFGSGGQQKASSGASAGQRSASASGSGQYAYNYSYAASGRSTSARAAAGKTPEDTSTAYRSEAERRRKAQEAAQQAAEQAAEDEEKGVSRPDTGAKVKEVFGWILVGFGALMAFAGILGAASVWEILSCIAVALGGGLLVFSGRQGKKKEAAFRRCLTVSGDKGVVKMKPLAKTLGMTEEELEKQLSEMIDRGYYGGRAYIDHARSLLVIEPEFMRDVYREEDEAKARRAEQQEQQAEDERRASLTEYERLVERLRQADIDIEDEPMSEKIRKMQALTEAIFAEVEKHPEKRPQIDRFMNYYLPTTLKLLDSYARIESQGVSGENTAKAKADIERIADTLVEGYSKQLDTLYRTEAVDIAGDAAVIESMLRRDGLAGDSDFRPFKQFVETTSAQPQAAEAQAAQAQTAPPAGEVMGGH